MRCTARLLGRVSLLGTLVLFSVACRGEGASDKGGEFGLYVAETTPVVRVTIAADVPRALIGFTESEFFQLGPGLDGNPNQYRIAVGPDGRVFGLDVINGLVRGGTDTGVPLIFGGAGAESFDIRPAPLALGTAGDNLFLGNVYPGRLRVFTANGEIVRDLEMDGSPWRLAGLPDETFIALQMETGVLGRYSEEGEELARYTVFQMPEEELGGEARLWPAQDFAAGRRHIFVTTAERYEVSAFDIDGGSAWVLKADAPLIAIPEHMTGRTLGRGRRAGRAAGGTIDSQYAQVKWPEVYPALARIETDAQDRLYVFPYVIEENPDRYPVDVYDATGTPILHGWLPFQGWDAFAGDSVYRIETRNDMVVVVRYELDLHAVPASRSAGQ